MTNELFERLLYEEESTTLDFKREQYRFVKATDEDKSEILKDILGFANAWRRSEAYILIGVEDVRGGRSNVIGIPAVNHLNDHSLQQFVNNLTTQPIHFHYEAFGFEGKQVGIVVIAQQTRPIYLKKDYGVLQREKVYVRRGSSTDPTKPASPEEIAQMRVGADDPTAELLVEFAHVSRDDALGARIAWNAEFCEMPDEDQIPNLSPPTRRTPSGFDVQDLYDPMNRLNKDFFRDLAAFEFARRLFRPVRLVMKNVGQVAANNVRVELTVPVTGRLIVASQSDLPPVPKSRWDLLANSAVRDIRPIRHEPGDVVIDRNTERYKVEIDCGDLQPGRRVWSEVFSIGKAESGDVSLAGLVFADNLPNPKTFALSISIKTTNVVITVEDLRSLPAPDVEDN